MEAEQARIKVFTVTGKLIEVVNSEHVAGYNQIEWRKPANISNGTYIYKIELIQNSQVVADVSGPLYVAR
jgi:hypothetical protein